MQLQALPCASSLHLLVPDLVVFRKWDPLIGTGSFWISPYSTAVAIPETPTVGATTQILLEFRMVYKRGPLNIHVRRGLGSLGCM